MNDNLVLDEASQDKDEGGVVVKFDLLLDDRSVHRWSESLSDDVLDKTCHQVPDVLLEVYLELHLQRMVTSDKSVPCGVSRQH